MSSYPWKQTSRSCHALLICLSLGALIAPSTKAQVTETGARRAEVIRGAVTNDSGRVMPGVTVIATMAPDRTFQQAVADSAGRYEIRFAQGTGDYLVYATSAGYRAFRRRIAIGSTGEIAVDIRLAHDATTLAAVRVTGARRRPAPDGGMLRDPTASAVDVSGLIGAVPPDLAGNLAALAATAPGIGVTADGRLTAFGMPGQVSTTVNGMSFAGTAIPSDMRTQVRVVTAAFDPSVGGFSGARINVELADGGPFTEVFGRTSLDASQLQAPGTVDNRLGQQYSTVALDGNASGPVGTSDLRYSSGLSLRARASRAPSMLSASPEAFWLSGVAADSIARLRAISQRLGVPVTTPAIPDAWSTQSLTAAARLGYSRDPMRYGAQPTDRLSLTALASIDRTSAPGTGATNAPSIGRRGSSGFGQLIGGWSHTKATYSAEVRSSIVAQRGADEPYVLSPTARVRLESQLDPTPADPVTTTLALGGSSLASASSSKALWETEATLQFYAGSAHLLKLSGHSQVSGVHQDAGSGPLGTFAFNSLADLEANRPTTFMRTLNVPAASARAWSGAFSLGDLWQVTPTFQLQPGVRVEANRFLTAPSRNPALETALGVTNTQVPNTVHASPRLGFTWQYRPTRAITGTGTATTGRITLPPRATISGGIGEFRNDLSAGLLMPVLMNTGLSGGAAQLTCVGDAVPVPAWRDYALDAATIPSACNDGASSTFVDAAPAVELFDRAYAPARSWRALLSAGSAVGVFRYSVNASYSYNLNQSGFTDLNFAGRPRFTLADEADRPIFVAPSSIVAGSGVVALADSRRSAAFGRVLNRVSDLRSTARQATITVAPEMDQTVLRLTYTLSDIRANWRGFDQVTFDSPVKVVTGANPYGVRHQLIVDAARQFGTSIGVSVRWSIRSGEPYTPLVGSDINGDGLRNDQAFVFDPAAVADQQLGRDLQALMHTAPRQARKCLSRQLGRVAAPNGCEGPWTSSMNAAISTGYFHVLDGRMMQASINLANPLGGLDQLLHGSNDLRGWGTPAWPNSVLYTVRGFDQSTRRYEYTVNPRFGSTRLSETPLRNPFRVTFGVRLELGTPTQKQLFERFLEMAPAQGNHARAPADTLRERLAERLVGDYYSILIGLRDSLLLTNAQVTALETARAPYIARAKAMWQEVAEYIVAQGDHYDLDEIRRRVDEMAVRVYALERREVPRMRAVMTPGQLELADIILADLVHSDERIPLRSRLF